MWAAPLAHSQAATLALAQFPGAEHEHTILDVEFGCIIVACLDNFKDRSLYSAGTAMKS